ncbi:MAG TPA: signal peptide peptidase SppA [Gammaproteobacteria bacterium]|nr:signal peptide peptidase SppA [Gammaproteobacteria bacterium]
MASSRGGFRRFVGGTLKGIDIARRVVVDILFIAIIVFILVLIFRPKGPSVPASAALFLQPQGMLVEQTPDPVRRAERQLVGQAPTPVARVRDLVWAADTAAGDSHIKAIVLDLDGFAGGSLAQLERVGAALRNFEKSGKPVIAYASDYSQGSYYLAAMATHAYLTTDQGIVALFGLAAYQNYYKDLIDKLKVQWHVFRVGKYKSYVEPFTRNDMSQPARQETTDLLDVLWNSYVGEVAHARGHSADEWTSLANHIPDALATTHGDAATLAVRSGLIDGIVALPVLRAKIAKIVGGENAGGEYRHIDLSAYLGARAPGPAIANRAWDQVAIIVAEGDIVTGSAPQGTIGADTMDDLLNQARNDDRIKAVVLDVNSPGGSALASDQILHAELALKASGKPLVVSMAGVAASGGYWISMAGDKIFASPATITGSIGIFGMLPTFEDTMAWAGVHRDGVETAPLADFGDPFRALDPQAAKVFQLTINHGYAEFTGNVAKYRRLPLSHVDEIAQGRVWPGTDAKRIGLIDDFGDLGAAVRSAASLAKLDNYGVIYLEPQLSPGEQFLVKLAGDGSVRAVSRHLFGGGSDLVASLRPVWEPLARALALHDPNGVYAYCFCAAATKLR